jgi:hypothetical protein
MLLAFACSFLSIVMDRTPFFYSALIFEASTEAGSVRTLWKEP